jgi:hypothetical protein
LNGPFIADALFPRGKLPPHPDGLIPDERNQCGRSRDKKWDVRWDEVGHVSEEPNQDSEKDGHEKKLRDHGGPDLHIPLEDLFGSVFRGEVPAVAVLGGVAGFHQSLEMIRSKRRRRKPQGILDVFQLTGPVLKNEEVDPEGVPPYLKAGIRTLLHAHFGPRLGPAI